MTSHHARENAVPRNDIQTVQSLQSSLIDTFPHILTELALSECIQICINLLGFAITSLNVSCFGIYFLSLRILEIFHLSDVASAERFSTTVRRTAVREAGLSQHYGDQTEGSLKLLEHHSVIILGGQ